MTKQEIIAKVNELIAAPSVSVGVCAGEVCGRSIPQEAG